MLRPPLPPLLSRLKPDALKIGSPHRPQGISSPVFMRSLYCLNSFCTRLAMIKWYHNVLRDDHVKREKSTEVQEDAKRI